HALAADRKKPHPLKSAVGLPQNRGEIRNETLETQ
ncbi:hypothetical protein LCGC14_2097390, partial [marine sediment metagenome]